MRARLSARPRITRTSKMPGEAVRPVSAARSGCATLPSFRSRSAAKALTAASVAATDQSATASRTREQRGQAACAHRHRAGAAAAASTASGRSAKMKAAPAMRSLRVLARSLSSGRAAFTAAPWVVSFAAKAAPSGRWGRAAVSVAKSSSSDWPAQVVGVDALQLGEIEARRAAADAVDVEPGDHVVERHDLVVAMAPAEARRDSCAAPRADSPWRDRHRRRAPRGAWRAWRRPARG